MPYNQHTHPWTNREVEILTDVYPESGIVGATKALAGRSRYSILSKAQHLNLHLSDLKVHPRNFTLRASQAIDSAAKLTEVQKAYLAGFFDGEGCISIAEVKRQYGDHHYHQLQIIYTNTNKAVMDYLCTTFGGTLLRCAASNRHRRPYWNWKLYSATAKVFLQIVYPFLIVKKAEAEVAIKFQTLMEKGLVHLSENIVIERDALAQQLKLLKGRIRD